MAPRNALEEVTQRPCDVCGRELGPVSLDSILWVWVEEPMRTGRILWAHEECVTPDGAPQNPRPRRQPRPKGLEQPA